MRDPELGQFLEPLARHYAGLSSAQSTAAESLSTFSADPLPPRPADEISPVCFAADAAILMADGTTKPIERILKGDRVRAPSHEDPEGPISVGEVVEVFRHAPRKLVNLLVDGHVVRATPKHPFYVRGRGFTPAADLRPGDELRAADGCWFAVGPIADQGQVEAVFNFQVAGLHTYFVGGADGGSSVLVHNESGVASSKSNRALSDEELKFMYFAVDVLYSIHKPADYKAVRKRVREELPNVRLIVPSEKGLPEKLDDLLGSLPMALNRLLEGVPSPVVTQFFALNVGGAKAVTIRNQIFFKKMPDVTNPKDVNTLFHELFHSVEQSLNIPNWFLDYLKDYNNQLRVNGNNQGMAYAAIPAEVRARAFGRAVAELLKDPKFRALFINLRNRTFDDIDWLLVDRHDPAYDDYHELAVALRNAYFKNIKEEEAFGKAVADVLKDPKFARFKDLGGLTLDQLDELVAKYPELREFADALRAAFRKYVQEQKKK